MFVIAYKMCIITKLSTWLIPPLNTYHSLLDSSTKNLKFILPSFTNSKYKKFLPSLILHCKKFAIY